MSRFFLFVTLLCFFLGVSGQSPSPPFWGGVPQYTVLVNMTNPEPVSTWQFTYYYDGTANASRYIHHPPQYDELCLGVVDPHHTCHVLFAVDGWSYLLDQDTGSCCKCSQSFGAVRYDWLQENSTFMGYAIINNVESQHWTKQGQYLNHFYVENQPPSRPVRFDELWGPQQILKAWDFNLDTFQPYVNKNMLLPPNQCDNRCSSEACTTPQ